MTSDCEHIRPGATGRNSRLLSLLVFGSDEDLLVLGLDGPDTVCDLGHIHYMAVGGCDTEGENRVINRIGTSLDFLPRVKRVRLAAPGDLPEYLPSFIINDSEIVLRVVFRKRFDKTFLRGGEVLKGLQCGEVRRFG